MAEIDNKILIGLFSIIVGIYGWLIKHISNSKKHICKDDYDRFKDSVQFKDVCQSKMEGMDNCFSGEIKRVEQVLGGKLDRIEGLIVKNGRRG